MGKLYLVGLPIGNIRDITLRAIDTLRDCDLILCEDTREFAKIANVYNISTKYISFHQFNEKKRLKFILNTLQNNNKVCLTSDRGSPCISDPGFSLVDLCIKNHIEYTSIPGASSSISAFSLSSLGNRFIFWGFIYKEKELKTIMKNLLPTIIFESPKRIKLLLAKMSIFDKTRRVVICKDLTKQTETIIHGCLGDKFIFDERGEFTLVLQGSEQNILADIDIFKNIECNKKQLIECLTKFTEIPKNIIYKKIIQNHQD